MKQKKRTLSRATLSQECYTRLLEDILNGRLKPGEKLRLGPIKQRFAMGQSPIREALTRLIEGGLVEAEARKGFRVTTISEEDVRDCYAIFTHIENKALALAIERGDDSWEALIVGELHKLELIENRSERLSYDVWAEQNYNFHVALISGCLSPTLLSIRRTLFMKFDRYCRMAYYLAQDTLSANHEEHKKLAYAVSKRQTQEAELLMTHHINGALEHVIQELKNHRLI